MPSTTVPEKKAVARKDVARLRELGKIVADIAAHPDQEEHRRVWTAVNDGAMIRPALLTRDTPVYLLNVDGELTTRIEDEFLAGIESQLLMAIYEWRHLRCHSVVEPAVLCPAALADSGYGIDISAADAARVAETSAEAMATARHFDRILDGEKDLDMIQFPKVEHNEDATKARMELLREIFAGVLEVRLFGKHRFRFVPWDDLLSWMGLEEGMYDFIENPEFMHMAMDRYVDATIHQARQYEALGMLSSNNGPHYIGSGGYGYTTRLAPRTESGVGAKMADMWGYVANQIFTTVSPDMTMEFAIGHEKKWAEMWGWIYYGCCERLDHKLTELRQLPNLRKVSLSPYANLEEGMEKMGGNLIVSFKPNSNYLANPEPDFDFLRNELVTVCKLARKYGCNLEILMKTIITLRNQPQRLWKWCDMAREIIAEY